MGKLQLYVCMCNKDVCDVVKRNICKLAVKGAQKMEVAIWKLSQTIFILFICCGCGKMDQVLPFLLSFFLRR